MFLSVKVHSSSNSCGVISLLEKPVLQGVFITNFHPTSDSTIGQDAACTRRCCSCNLSNGTYVPLPVVDGEKWGHYKWPYKWTTLSFSLPYTWSCNPCITSFGAYFFGNFGEISDRSSLTITVGYACPEKWLQSCFGTKLQGRYVSTTTVWRHPGDPVFLFEGDFHIGSPNLMNYINRSPKILH